MGFDKDEPGPVVQPQKRTTQVNIWMGVALLFFFGIGAVAIAYVHYHPRQVSHEENQQVQREMNPPPAHP